jgi:hypothetical protein
MIVGIAVLLPFALLKVKGLILLFIGFGYLGFVVAIAWMPYWIMIMVSLLVAFLYAGKFKGML